MFTLIFIAGFIVGILKLITEQKTVDIEVYPTVDNSDEIAAIEKQIEDYRLELEYLKKLDSYLPEETSLDTEKQTRQRLILQRQIRTVNHKIESLYTKKEKLE